MIPNPVVKSRFSLLARAGGLRPYSLRASACGFLQTFDNRIPYEIQSHDLGIWGDLSPAESKAKEGAGRDFKTF